MAAETFRIEIPIRIEDQTEPGVGSATRKINAFDKTMQQTQDRLDKMNRTKYEVAVEALDKASSVIGRISESVKGVAGKVWRITMGVLDKATAPLRGIINILKNPILQAGAILGISVGLKDTIDTYATFEATMSKVKAISGATAAEFADLNAKAKQMGATTKYTATEAGEAFSYMAMAGWEAEQMIDGIEGIMALAAASGEDLATTSDIVTDALTAFGLQAKDSAHFADVLAVASSSANTTVAGMGETFKYVAPLAGAMGYSIEDMSQAIGLMANSGVKGSQAGTALKTAISNLVTPTSDQAALMKELGISMTDANGDALAFGDVLQSLRRGFSQLSETEKTAAASTLFGSYAMSGMLGIINATEEEYEALAESIANADGAAQEMADTMLDNLAGSFTLLQSAAEGVKITLGERLKPHLQRFVTWLTGKMPDIEKAVGHVMDFVDQKIEWLTDTIREFTSGEEWENANIWGKIKIAWDKIIAEPFSEWWGSTGKQWFIDKAASIGEGIGSGITAGLLAILGFDIGGAVEDGKTIGGAFIQGFKDGFDTEQITEALKNWANNNKAIVVGLGVILGGKLISGIARGVSQGKTLFNDIKNILGRGGGAAGSLGGGLSSYATSTMTVTANMVYVSGANMGNAARTVSNMGGPGMGGAGMAGRALLGPGGGGGSTLALPGPVSGTGGAGAAGKVLQTLQLGNGSYATYSSPLIGLLGKVGVGLGSGATTAGGAAAVGGSSIAGGILGLLGIGSGIKNIWQGTKLEGKEAQDKYWQGGTKIGMVGTGAAAGAAIGSIFGGVGAVPGALIGAGIGGLGALFGGEGIGKWLSDISDNIGEWVGNMGTAIKGFFTETLPEKWGQFWEGVGNFFTETVPYALGYAVGKVQVFFTETLPQKWTEFWTGVGNFFTETIPAWWENIKTGVSNFFTVTLPAKWTEFWEGVGNFFTETIPAWWENIKTGVSTFFTETLPQKWSEFWEGIGNFFTETIPNWWEGFKETVSNFFGDLKDAWSNFWGGLWGNIKGFFGGVWDSVTGAFSSGYSDATEHAWGGIMTQPHMGIVAEDGPESIIPLAPSKRARGIDLWEQTGRNLGVTPYADGGIVGDTDEPQAITADTGGMGGGFVFDIDVEVNPEFVIEGSDSMDEETIVAIIKARIREMADDIGDELAERLARIFANMPVKGGA